MIGVDLVHIPSFKAKMQDPAAKGKLFSADEIQHSNETLAGIFAAKEAFVKASGVEPDWQSIIVTHTENGKPILSHPSFSEGKVKVSVTHEQDYACAMVIIL